MANREHRKPSDDSFSDEPITVVIPRISTRELAEQYRAQWAAEGLVSRAELARQGLVENGGVSS